MNILSYCLNKVYKTMGKYRWVTQKFVSVVDRKMKDTILADCVVASSHNSMLGALQILGPVSLDFLKEVLNNNFRMIELDVYRDDLYFVVAHGTQDTMFTSTIRFSLCLRMIRDYGWKDTDLPLFLCIDANFDLKDSTYTREFNNLCRQYVGDRILYTTSRQLGSYTLGELRNKLVIISANIGSDITRVNYTTLYGSVNFTNLSNDDEKIPKPYGYQLIRIYPDNLLVSTNYDWYKFTQRGVQFPTINAFGNKRFTRNYLRYFERMGILMKY